MNRRHRTDAAIAYALERRWDRAAEENRALLDEDKTDVEAANRLGKALTELGDVPGAIEAYEHALNVDATNAIARKNLARLEEQRKAKRPARAARPTKARTSARAPEEAAPRRIDVATASLRTSPIIEDFGKSADLTLERVAPRAAAQVSVGDPVQLELTSSGVSAKTAGGAIIGHLDPRSGLRLRRMMQGGNRYSAVVVRASDGQVVVHVRETYKHPSLVGQASFLPQAGDPRRRRSAPRAYTKTSVVQYGRSDDDEDFESEDDEEDVWRPRAGEDSDEEDIVEDDEDDFVGELGADDDDDADTAFETEDDDAGDDDDDD